MSGHMDGDPHSEGMTNDGMQEVAFEFLGGAPPAAVMAGTREILSQISQEHSQFRTYNTRTKQEIMASEVSQDWRQFNQMFTVKHKTTRQRQRRGSSQAPLVLFKATSSKPLGQIKMENHKHIAGLLEQLKVKMYEYNGSSSDLIEVCWIPHTHKYTCWEDLLQRVKKTIWEESSDIEKMELVKQGQSMEFINISLRLREPKLKRTKGEQVPLQNKQHTMVMITQRRHKATIESVMERVIRKEEKIPHILQEILLGKEFDALPRVNQEEVLNRWHDEKDQWIVFAIEGITVDTLMLTNGKGRTIFEQVLDIKGVYAMDRYRNGEEDGKWVVTCNKNNLDTIYPEIDNILLQLQQMRIENSLPYHCYVNNRPFHRILGEIPIRKQTNQATRAQAVISRLNLRQVPSLPEQSSPSVQQQTESRWNVSAAIRNRLEHRGEPRQQIDDGPTAITHQGPAEGQPYMSQTTHDLGIQHRERAETARRQERSQFQISGPNEEIKQMMNNLSALLQSAAHTGMPTEYQLEREEQQKVIATITTQNHYRFNQLEQRTANMDAAIERILQNQSRIEETLYRMMHRGPADTQERQESEHQELGLDVTMNQSILDISLMHHADEERADEGN